MPSPPPTPSQPTPDSRQLSPENSAPLSGYRAMLFAAGLGTRLKPFTDHHPKALAPVNGKPLLQRNIEYMKSYGVEDFIVNTHHFAEQIVAFLDDHDNFGVRVTISYEAGQPLETGGGLKKAAWFFERDTRPFLVMNSDILTNLDLGAMVRFHETSKPLATLAVTHRKSSRNFLFDGDLRLCGWTNFQTGEKRLSRPDTGQFQPLAFTCVHVIEPAILPLITQTGKFSIIDSYLDLARTHEIRGYLHDKDCVVDVGRPESIEEAEQHFK
jgi:NDP-sugar pyrophosphorylase family protein